MVRADLQEIGLECAALLFCRSERIEGSRLLHAVAKTQIPRLHSDNKVAPPPISFTDRG